MQLDPQKLQQIRQAERTISMYEIECPVCQRIVEVIFHEGSVKCVGCGKGFSYSIERC